MIGKETFPCHHGNSVHTQKASMNNHNGLQKSVKRMKNKSLVKARWSLKWKIGQHNIVQNWHLLRTAQLHSGAGTVTSEQSPAQMPQGYMCRGPDHKTSNHHIGRVEQTHSISSGIHMEPKISYPEPATKTCALNQLSLKTGSGV